MQGWAGLVSRARRLGAVTVGALALAAASAGATAATVSYEAIALGGGNWRYDYTVGGDAPAGGFDGLTIYFDIATTGTLLNVVAPSDWDALLIPPDAGVPDDGFVDLVRLSGPLQGTFTPFDFSVEFSFTGAGAPASQVFELYLSAPFAVVEAGTTTSANAVPEPTTLALGGLALLVAIASAPAARRRG